MSKVKKLIQRIKNGFDDEEIYSLDHSLAKLILPRLKRFKKVKKGHPSTLSEEEWDKILDEMIYCFGRIADDNYFDLELEEEKRLQNGLETFAKYYMNLWW